VIGPDEPPGSRIAAMIGGRIDYDLPGSPHATKYIVGVSDSYENVLEIFDENGLEPFFDPHWAHWGGKDFRMAGAPEGAWYHVTVGYPYRLTVGYPYRRKGVSRRQRQTAVMDPSLPPPWITVHEDGHQPGSWDHFWKDFVPQVLSRLNELRNRRPAAGTR